MPKKDKFIIPAKRKQPTPTEDGRKVRISDEAYAALCEMYNESTLSFKELVSMAVMFAAEHAVYLKDEAADE